MDPRIEALQRRAAATPGLINLGGGLPAEVQFPKRALARAFLKALGRQGAPALQYGWAEGSLELRRWVAERLHARGASVAPDDIIITSGAQQAIALGLELVCRPGDLVGVDAATYPAALELIAERHLRAVPRWRDVGARYVMPALGNPSGRELSREDRRAVCEGKAAILEDDAYADLRFEGPAPRPLLADLRTRVLHVGTLSKTLCPGLRIGWLVVPPRLRARALRLKASQDLQASSLAQSVACEYLLGGEDFEARLVRLRRFYRARAHKLLRVLRTHLPDWSFSEPEGGFAVWAHPPSSSGNIPDEVHFLTAALAEGVSFDPGSSFRPDRAATPLALRLCFSAAPSASFEEGAVRLARAWRRVNGRRRRDEGRRRRPRSSAERAAA
jgi:2-aminoadipate transaminase